jgi:hypothetical protein
LLEGSAEGLVAAFQIQKRLVREAEADMRRLANNSKLTEDERNARMRETARLYVNEKRHLADITQEIKRRNAEERRGVGGQDGKGTGEHPLELGVKAGRRYREVANQLAYGLGDIMSIQGGIAEMIRASANNVQYMAAQIPGAAGRWAMFGAVAAQALGMVAAKTIDIRDRQKEADDALKESQKSYKELARAVDEVMMLEDERERENRRRDMAEKANKALVAVQKAQDVLTEEERAQRGEGRYMYTEPLRALMNLQFQKLPNLMMNLYTGKGLSTEGPITGVADSRQDLINAEAALAARRLEAAEAMRLRDLATTGFDAKLAAKNAEQAIQKSKPELEAMYLGMLAKGKSESDAKMILQEVIREGLIPAEQKGAEKVAEGLVREFRIAMAGEQFKQNIAAIDPNAGANITLHEELRAAKTKLAEAEAEARKDSVIESGEKYNLRMLQMDAQRIEALIKAIENNTKTQQETNRRGAAGNGKATVPPIDDGGNL